jgi:excinuclease ABC subunit B
MKKAVDETNRRRKLQKEFNRKYGITPETIKKSIQDIMGSVYEADYYTVSAAEEVGWEYVARDKIPKRVKKLRKEMMAAAKEMEFERAAELRDRLKSWRNWS